MITANKQLRTYMKLHSVPYWKLANALNVAESTLIRWLRTELTADQTKYFITKVDQIIKEKEQED